MSLAKKEAKTITQWRSVEGIAYNSQRLAELNSITHITGTPFVHDLEELDTLLKKLVSHYDLREWLMEQMPDQPSPQPRFDILKLQDLPSKLADYWSKSNFGGSTSMMREIAILMEQDGYRLIKL